MPVQRSPPRSKPQRTATEYAHNLTTVNGSPAAPSTPSDANDLGGVCGGGRGGNGGKEVNLSVTEGAEGGKAGNCAVSEPCGIFELGSKENQTDIIKEVAGAVARAPQLGSPATDPTEVDAPKIREAQQ